MKSWLGKTREACDAFIDRIPRKAQVLINLVLILVFGFGWYTFLDAPTFSLEQEFRREEKRHMVGPSDILGIEEINNVFVDSLVIGQTDAGFVLYADPWPYGFVYREKEGSLTACVMPGTLPSISPPEGDDLTVILFDDYPDAVRAELDMEIFWENGQTGKQYRYQYTLTGNRKNTGYIRMDLDVQWTFDQFGGESSESITVSQVVAHAGDIGYEAPAGEFPATVRLYDENNVLICNEDIFLFPQAEQTTVSSLVP